MKEVVSCQCLWYSDGTDIDQGFRTLQSTGGDTVRFVRTRSRCQSKSVLTSPWHRLTGSGHEMGDRM